MSWQDDIARRQAELQVSEGDIRSQAGDKPPLNPEQEVADLMSAAGSPSLANQINTAEKVSDNTIGLDEALQDALQEHRSAPRAPAMRSKKDAMAEKKKLAKKKTAAKKAAPSEATPPANTEPEDSELPDAPADPGTDPFSFLSQLPGAPSRGQVDAWKRQWGGVYMLPIEDTVYLYRYLQYFEWEREILSQEELVKDENALREAVLTRAILWPKLDPLQQNARQAGLPRLMYEVVMRSSYFIDPGDAMMAVVKL